MRAAGQRRSPPAGILKVFSPPSMGDGHQRTEGCNEAGRRLIDLVFSHLCNQGLATLIEIAETDRSDMASKRSVTAISIS
jgi:hypothetical protein